jgi:hypothetical protein
VSVAETTTSAPSVNVDFDVTSPSASMTPKVEMTALTRPLAASFTVTSDRFFLMVTAALR